MKATTPFRLGSSYLKAQFGIRSPICCKIRITQECNSNCTHCFNHLEKPVNRELTTAEWLLAVDKLIKAGSLLIVFVGGEPTLRHDLFEIAAYSKKNGAYTGLITNGQYNQRSMAEEIDRYFDSITFSIDGLEIEHDQLRGCGSFAKCVNNCKELLRTRKKVGVNSSFVITNDNYRQMPGYAHFCKELGVDRIKFQPNFFPKHKIEDTRKFSKLIVETKKEFGNFMSGSMSYYRGIADFFQDIRNDKFCIHDDGFEIAIASDGALTHCSVPPYEYCLDPNSQLPYNILNCSVKDLQLKKLSNKICKGCYRLDCFILKNLLRKGILQGIQALIN